MKKPLLLACLALLAASSALQAQNPSNPVARFHTDLGEIDVSLLRDVAPNNVANFLRYVSRSDYDNSFVHRSIPDFILQGGGYKFVNNNIVSIPADPPVANEFHLSNTRGTLAMAKVNGDPNSATSQWFFNQADNSSNLDFQNGGFTVFGRIVNDAGYSTMDAIGALPRVNAGSPFDQLPVRNFGGGTIQDSNLVHVISIRVISKFLTLSQPSANVIHLQGFVAANTAYTIQSSSSPAANSFAPLVTLTSDAAGNISYNDTNPGTKKFYRLANP